MQTIVTPELTLEPLHTSHAEAMFELLRDPAIYEYLDYSPPASVEYLRDVYARLEARRSPDGSEAWLNWVIHPRDHPLVGYVQATVASRSKCACRVCPGKQVLGPRLRATRDAGDARAPRLGV